MQQALVKHFPSETIIKETAQFIAEQIEATLKHTQRKVLVLLSGGSAIEMYKDVLAKLPPAENLPYHHLLIGLVDERFGEYGHPDSNEQQLREKGVISEFEKRGALFMGMLSDTLESGTDAGQRANQAYQNLFGEADHIIALVGIGDDGHTAGWLPTQTLAKFTQLYDGDRYVSYYEVDPEDSNNPFTYRLTTTVHALHQATQVIVFAKGQGKLAALEKVISGVSPLNDTPAIALRQGKSPLIICTDQVLTKRATQS